MRKMLVSAVVATLLMGNSAFAQTVGGCPGGDGARSAKSDTGVNLTFQNGTNETLTAFWINFGGQRVRYADIKPGRSWSVDTYAGHPWAFVTEYGTCVDLYYANKGDRRHTIR